nr:uncharacterized protein LOC124817077 [Hydra vulgaris]
MAGKGTHRVPVIILADNLRALSTISNISIRNKVNIPKNNPYLFACTRNSNGHTSGWNAIDSIVKTLPLKKPENFNATKNRHRLSSIFATLDLSTQDRDLWFKDIGHSEETNKSTYQIPLGMLDIVKVGRRLMNIELGTSASTFIPPESQNECQKSTDTSYGGSSSLFTDSESCASQNARKSTDKRYGATSCTFNPSESFAYPNASQKSAYTIYEGTSSSTFIPSESFTSQNERQKSTNTSYGSILVVFAYS